MPSGTQTSRAAGERTLTFFLALLLSVIIGCSVSSGREGKNLGAAALTTTGSDGSEQLTVAGVRELRSLIDTAALPELNHPDFEDYRTELEKFYNSTGGTLPWLHGGKPTPQARAAIHLLEAAEHKGLIPEDYDSSRWEGRVARLDQSDWTSDLELVRFDLALSVSAMRYISDLSVGRANPGLFHSTLNATHGPVDLPEFLRSAIVHATDVEASMATLDPPFPAYRRTIAALNLYLELARQDNGERLQVPPRPVKPGDSYADVPHLERLLILIGDLQGGNVTALPVSVYEGTLVEAVKHFQQRHGLDPNGRLDALTFKQLNTPLSRRVLQLDLTLERWRWLPHQFDRPPIVVNIPEFRLHADGDQNNWALSMKVVVGKAYGHQTPVLSSAIRSVIFRPPWDVPLSIVRAEFLPKIKKDPTYLERNSYDIVDRDGHVVSKQAADPEVQAELRSGKLQIRQRPGPENALGLIKFDFPNPFDVYMHGTPAMTLFSKSRRDFSHGCIRVEDPVALAEWILKDMPEWTPERMKEAMHGDETIRVKLDRPIPVLIVYGTAVVMEDGEVRFFDDIYGQDASLGQILAKGRPYTQAEHVPQDRRD